MASHLHMSLQECREKTTYRQLRLWITWLDEQWNVPDKLTYYLMQIAAEVRRVLSKKPSAIKLSHFLLKFTSGGKKVTKTQAAKNDATWLSYFGFKKNDPDEV